MTGLRIGELFAGYGGLGQGVQSVLGGDIAWVSEIDPGACKILAHRFPDIPNHGDITAIDWAAVEPVDVLTGGFPCQDVSAAGKRAGIRPDTRSGLWSQFAYAIDQLRPPLVVIENVRGLLSADAHHPAHSDLEPCPWCVGDGPSRPLRALGAVLGELADLGYDASWQGVRASDVGAPHGRFRVFVVAWPAQDPDITAGGERWLAAPGQAEGGRTRPDAGRRGGAPAGDASSKRVEGDRARGAQVARAHAGSGVPVRSGPVAPADSSSDGRDQRRTQPARLVWGSDAAERSASVAPDADVHGFEGLGRELAGERDADGCSGPHTAWGQYEPAVRRWEAVLGRSAPTPTEVSVKGSARLSPRFVEFLMGLPVGWVTDVPGLSRNEQLKALGNGVVPQQAAHALRLLLPDVAVAA